MQGHAGRTPRPERDSQPAITGSQSGRDRFSNRRSGRTAFEHHRNAIVVLGLCVVFETLLCFCSSSLRHFTPMAADGSEANPKYSFGSLGSFDARSLV